MLRWWSLATPEDQWQKEVLQWIHNWVKKDKWSIKESQDWSKQNPVYKDVERT